jgi:hypothetical protein
MGEYAGYAREQEEDMRCSDIEETWTAQDGRVYNISDMGDSHLVNTVGMLERKGYTTHYKYEILVREKEARGI